jgi:hypothetical protein
VWGGECVIELSLVLFGQHSLSCLAESMKQGGMVGEKQTGKNNKVATMTIFLKS